jgi:hypothetical protein
VEEEDCEESEVESGVGMETYKFGGECDVVVFRVVMEADEVTLEMFSTIIIGLFINPFSFASCSRSF